MSRVNVCVAEILRVDFLRVQDTNTHGHGNHSVRDQTKLNVAGVSFRGRNNEKIHTRSKYACARHGHGTRTEQTCARSKWNLVSREYVFMAEIVK